MVNYNLPKIKIPRLKDGKIKTGPKEMKLSQVLILVVLVSSFSGFLAGIFSGAYFYWEAKGFIDEIVNSPNSKNVYSPPTSQEQMIISAVERVSPAVVSIIISKEQPVYEEYYTPFFEFMVPQYRQKGVEKKQIGGGTGFIISDDGMILTNKHVVLDEEAEYSILTSDDKEFSVEILARDPFQDIAILKIIQKEGEKESFKKIKLGDSDKIKTGQTVIAIGYALGRYQNTISVGVVSGLGRTITASGGGFYETLEDIIQTDAAINRGNSGGPLLNLKGEVIGINTAVDFEGQNIGFTVPINKAKRDIEQVKNLGKIVYPFLGIRYIVIDKDIQEQNDLASDYGAWIIKGEDEPAVVAGSPAQKAGLKEGDIILEFDGEKITVENNLAKIILKFNPGDKISLKIKRNGAQETIEVVLAER